MELRDDMDAVTGPAGATTALESAHATAEPVHAGIAHVTRVSSQRPLFIILSEENGFTEPTDVSRPNKRRIVKL